MELNPGSHGRPGRLRAGDWVIVRSREEILATLDKRGCLDGLPFQPEMFAFCGRRLRVWKIAHKTCDTINKTGGRRMRDAVHLEGARCDGTAHGNCQADCNLFWKESWLRPAGDETKSPVPMSATPRCSESDVITATKAASQEDPADPTWACQTTKLFEATGPLPWWDVRQYVRDVTSGNHTSGHMLRLLAFGAFRSLLNVGVGYRFLLRAYDGFQKICGGKPYPVAEGTIPAGQPTPHEVLDLKPGEWVEVRPIEQIRATLNTRGFNRGMWFDQEMVQYCGGRFQVEMRVERLIDERSGKMLQMKNPCIQLNNVYCRATCTAMRLGCPRAVNTYWRENWLQRADAAGD